MNKIKLLVASLSLILPLSTALAQETITFHGQVTDVTCDVALDGGVDKNTVWLPSIAKADITAVGAVTQGATDFAFNLTGCPASSAVAVRMKGNTPSANGNLSNVETATNKAESVEIQIVDQTAGQPIDFSAGGLITVGETTSSAAGDVTIPFTAKYFAADTVNTVGLVQASLDYEIIYP